MVVNRLRNVTKITEDFDFFGIVSCFATRMVPYLCNISTYLVQQYADILDKFLSLPKTGTNAEYLGTIILSIAKIAIMHDSMYMMLRKR